MSNLESNSIPADPTEILVQKITTKLEKIGYGSKSTKAGIAVHLGDTVEDAQKLIESISRFVQAPEEPISELEDPLFDIISNIEAISYHLPRGKRLLNNMYDKLFEDEQTD